MIFLVLSIGHIFFMRIDGFASFREADKIARQLISLISKSLVCTPSPPEAEFDGFAARFGGIHPRM